jgi:hypothetical protein
MEPKLSAPADSAHPLVRAWSGALASVQHEALELVTVGDLETRPLCPHAEPYAENPCNRGLRDGLSPELTPESLIGALAVVMDREHAERLVS